MSRKIGCFANRYTGLADKELSALYHYHYPMGSNSIRFAVYPCAVRSQTFQYAVLIGTTQVPV